MKYFMVGLLALFILLAPDYSAKAEFYHGGDGQIALRVDSLKVAIKFDLGRPTVEVFEQVVRLLDIADDSNMVDGFESVHIAAGGDLYAFIDSLNSTDGILAAEPYYYVDDSLAAPVGEQLVVRFDSSMSKSDVEQFALAHDADTVRELEYMSNVFVLRNTSPQTQRLVDLANEIHGEAGVDYSHPVFGLRPVLYAYKLFDRYNGNQAHLKKIIGTFNSASVWDFYGAKDTVVVAVDDDGVTTHEDLPAARVLGGRDYSSIPYDNNPAPGSVQGHGMGCAGIIAASHTTDSVAGINTSSGVISMSPAIKILPVKIFDDAGVGTTSDQLAAAIVYAYQSGASVLSNSWGYNTNLDLFPVIDDAIDRAATLGRGGKGCPVIFSSGNGSAAWVGYPAFRSNCFAVGAINLSDARWSYSNYGSALDIVAPSGNTNLAGDVWTLDQMGSAGFNPNQPVSWNCSSPNDQDYDCHFGGTSAACPFVAGAAALLLSKAPTLTRAQVYTYLDSSAVKIGATQPNTEYGWGRVDAFRAVLSVSHGDVNNDGLISLVDLSSLTSYLTGGGFTPFPSVKLGDWNCNGSVELADLSACVAYLQGISGATPPVKPCFKF
ncbi:MAG: S8 family serine peptidase [Candidatus Zixiibacteriota bacterium]